MSNRKLTFALAVVSSLCLLPAFGSAYAGQNEEHEKNARERTLTGCLSSTDKADEYRLVTEDGSSWEIHTKTVKLGEHVGHTVTVTGKVWHPDAHGAKEKTKEAVDPNASEHGHLQATSVSMVSESCRR